MKFRPINNRVLSPKKEEQKGKTCTRFNSLQKKRDDIKSAIMCASMISEGCKTRSALKFCTKPFCRVDATARHYGPKDFRSLKLNKNQFGIVNVHKCFSK